MQVSNSNDFHLRGCVKEKYKPNIKPSPKSLSVWYHGTMCFLKVFFI
jgi:hypothetical protein